MIKCYVCAGKRNLSELELENGEKVYVCSKCIKDASGDIILQDKLSDILINKDRIKNEFNFEILSPKEIKEKLDEVVIGQDYAKKILATEVFKHYIRLNNKKILDETDIKIRKTNILLTGLTGTGKTLLLQTLGKIIGVPIYIADATSLTQAGYVGDDVETILLGLINNCNGDVSLAERGIVFLDEIDKIAKKGESVSITRDVSGEGVQQALLKIVEGTIVRVPMNHGRKHPQLQMYEVNTEDILFVAGGAFVGIEEIVTKRLNKNISSTIGFNSKSPILSKRDINIKKIRQNIISDDLKSFGMIPELLGRFPKIANLEPLNEEDLVKIMKESKTSLIKEYELFFEIQQKKLIFEDVALLKIAEIAIESNLGARGLQAIIESIMLDIVYTMTGNKKKTYTITEDIVIQACFDESDIA